MNDTVIQVDNIYRRYGRHTAVEGISFDVKAGEVFGLLGPNGAGKTTTILMLLGLTETSSGTIRVLNLDPQRQPLAVKEQVGYMPDSIGFYDALSALDNLRYTAALLDIPTNERDERIYQALDRVGLKVHAKQKVQTFSHGMKRRLGLAEIIMKRARIAILDEPTSGLDPHSTDSFLALIEGLKAEQVSVVLSSHLLDQMQRICDRVALFHRGKLALVGSVNDLAQDVLGSTENASLDHIYRTYFEQEVAS